MMDLPQYLDSFRLGYERALEDLQGQLASLTQTYMPARVRTDGTAATAGRAWCARARWPPRHSTTTSTAAGITTTTATATTTTTTVTAVAAAHDCRCECCIVDADYVVYARCFERRLVPIRDRERHAEGPRGRHARGERRAERRRPGAALEGHRPAGNHRSRSRRAAPPRSTCSSRSAVATATTTMEVKHDTKASRRSEGDRAAQAAEAASRTDVELADVDDCEVGYVTIRVDGCLIRPIVVAIAVLPRDCDAYHAGCSCSCCC